MRKPRIALIGHLAGNQVYGAERSLLDTLAAIDRSRYDVSFVLPRSGLRTAIRRFLNLRSNNDYLHAVRQHTNEIHVLPYHWWRSEHPIDFQTVSRFVDYFRTHKIDLVHVNTITLMDPLIAARKLRIPSIVHARELVDQDEELAKLFAAKPHDIVDQIRAAADFIICNSDATHNLFYKRDRSFRLYNSVDVRDFDLPNNVKPDRLRIGIVSSNRPAKGIDHFVQLAIQAAAFGPGLEFVVVGPRNDFTNQLELTVKRERNVNLRFTGYIAKSLEALRPLNVVVSFSTFAESFGRSIAEGMAARRPVIIYNRGAPPEYVRDGVDGFIIQPSDLEAAMKCIQKLRNNPDRVRTMGEAARSRVTELFSPKAIATQLNAIYRGILP